MNIAEVVKQLIRILYGLSPYFWVDRFLKNRESIHPPQSEAWQSLRNKRLLLSEFYIVAGLVVAIALWVWSTTLGLWAWVTILMMLRVIGIINKELGVILFGICKITEGTAVSATGRVIVLALVNYTTAMFLFAATYQTIGNFADVPVYLDSTWPLASLFQAMNIHFTLSAAFTANDLITWSITTGQGAFCFIFGTMILSLFVSLLNFKPLKA
ncbi:MAG: hypothetical protein GXO35_08065 [Gammaproteobacteria bacterium]|nr:hypothetical protein [Gammaproteobacteria bacterium]